MDELKSSYNKMMAALDQVEKHGVSLGLKSGAEALISYKATKHEYVRKGFNTAYNEFLTRLDALQPTKEILAIRKILKGVDLSDTSKAVKVFKSIAPLLDTVRAPERALDLKQPYLPDAIRDDVEADVRELEACFSHGLYRSAIILCGRVLETVLHRKYYETVGVDLLEKSPGIGLGKIIAKLLEKEVDLDPGLTQQIHLINQVRIFTVHRKQKAFCPSKAQAHAMVLYTMDVIEKLF